MLPLESRKWKTCHLIIPRASSTNKNTGSGNCDSVKQILFGQRILESYKWKLEDGWCQHQLFFKEKEINKHLVQKA
jgi:hypothetical protein